MTGILASLVLQKGTAKLLDFAFDAYIAGLDRSIIAGTIRQGEKDGLTQEQITDKLLQRMKDHGIEADRNIADIPD